MADFPGAGDLEPGGRPGGRDTGLRAAARPLGAPPARFRQRMARRRRRTVAGRRDGRVPAAPGMDLRRRDRARLVPQPRQPAPHAGVADRRRGGGARAPSQQHDAKSNAGGVGSFLVPDVGAAGAGNVRSLCRIPGVVGLVAAGVALAQPSRARTRLAANLRRPGRLSATARRAVPGATSTISSARRRTGCRPTIRSSRCAWRWRTALRRPISACGSPRPWLLAISVISPPTSCAAAAPLRSRPSNSSNATKGTFSTGTTPPRANRCRRNMFLPSIAATCSPACGFSNKDAGRRCALRWWEPRACGRLADTAAILAEVSGEDPSLSVPLRAVRRLLRGDVAQHEFIARLRMTSQAAAQLQEVRQWQTVPADEPAYWASSLAREAASWTATVNRYLRWMETLSRPPNSFLHSLSEELVDLRRQAVETIPSLHTLAKIGSAPTETILMRRGVPGLRPEAAAWLDQVDTRIPRGPNTRRGNAPDVRCPGGRRPAPGRRHQHAVPV